MPTTMPDVRDFLALRRIAFIGLSRDPRDFSRALFSEMCAKGYDMVPVNPAATEIDGRRCYPRVQDVAPSVDGALVMTAPRDSYRVVRDCAAAGIRHIWLHRGGGQGSVTPEALALCHEQGIHVIEGQCPFMFLPETRFFHRFHGFVLKVTGGYPREVRRA